MAYLEVFRSAGRIPLSVLSLCKQKGFTAVCIPMTESNSEGSLGLITVRLSHRTLYPMPYQHVEIYLIS